jgi:hypothetical protein
MPEGVGEKGLAWGRRDGERHEGGRKWSHQHRIPRKKCLLARIEFFFQIFFRGICLDFSEIFPA